MQLHLMRTKTALLQQQLLLLVAARRFCAG
jgi:hypothetical protein